MLVRASLSIGCGYIILMAFLTDSCFRVLPSDSDFYDDYLDQYNYDYSQRLSNLNSMITAEPVTTSTVATTTTTAMPACSPNCCSDASFGMPFSTATFSVPSALQMFGLYPPGTTTTVTCKTAFTATFQDGVKIGLLGTTFTLECKDSMYSSPDLGLSGFSLIICA